MDKEFTNTRFKKSDKSKHTFEKYGKNTTKGVRIKQAISLVKANI